MIVPMMEEMDLEILADEAAELLSRRHEEGLRANERIHLQLSPGLERLRITLSLSDPLADSTTEFVAELAGPTDEAAIHLVLDFLDGVLAEHLQSDREAMPLLDPAPYTFEGRTISLCGQRRRPDLEAQADALLAAAGPGDDEPS